MTKSQEPERKVDPVFTALRTSQLNINSVIDGDWNCDPELDEARDGLISWRNDVQAGLDEYAVRAAKDSKIKKAVDNLLSVSAAHNLPDFLEVVSRVLASGKPQDEAEAKIDGSKECLNLSVEYLTEAAAAIRRLADAVSSE